MPQPLPIDWKETERACLAGVPINQVAKRMAESAGLDYERTYTAIRKRISRERWPLPDAIIRRAKVQARVAAGVAKDAKEAAIWRKGDSVLDEVAQSREALITGVPRDSEEHFVTNCAEGGESGAESAIVEAENGRGALREASPSALDLVTEDLTALGNRGLRSILVRATEAAEAMQQAPDVRSWQDVQTMTKVIQAAAGLDKPAVAVAVSLNSSGNATVAAWESA